jgi:DNA-binding NarL/FixJ family response regulator
MTILEQWRELRADPTVAPLERLTPRERDVLRALTDGLSTKAIARELGVAVKTVENHKIHVFDKLGVRTHAQAVAVAIGHGLLADCFAPAASGG